MLIINADDLGLAAGVDQGILEAHQAGAVTSASMLVTLEDFEHAAALARSAPSLGVGLHFDLLAGRPLTRGASISDPQTGGFLPLGVLARRAFSGRIDPAEVYAECAAQIARLHGAGLEITHVDSHRHVHCLPGVWEGVVRAAREAGPMMVRRPFEPFSMNIANVSATGKKVALAASFRRASRQATTPRAARFVGISLQGGSHFARRLHRFLDAVPPGVTELMVHPGYDTPELARLDAYRSAREVELAALTSPAVRERLRAIDLARFDSPAVRAYAEEL